MRLPDLSNDIRTAPERLPEGARADAALVPSRRREYIGGVEEAKKAGMRARRIAGMAELAPRGT